MVWIWDPVLQIMESFSEKTLHMTLFMSLPSIITKCFMIQEVYLMKMYWTWVLILVIASQFSKLMEWLEILYKKIKNLNNGTWLSIRQKEAWIVLQKLYMTGFKVWGPWNGELNLSLWNNYCVWSTNQIYMYHTPLEDNWM